MILTNIEADRDALREKVAGQANVISDLRALIARAHRAYYKPEWEEGECFNEVASDLHWEGIGVPKMEAELERDAAKEPTR